MRSESITTKDAQNLDQTDPVAWVDRHGDAIFRFALQRVKDRDVAEDLVQETLLAALKARERFRGNSTERTWLIGILRHKIVDYIRRRALERAPLESEGNADSTRVDDMFDEKGKWRQEPPHWPGDPLTPLEREELRRAIDQCADKLPSSLADVFMLREMEQMDTETICQALAISPTNLWTRLHRMRILLRVCLEQNWLGTSPAKDTNRGETP